MTKGKLTSLIFLIILLALFLSGCGPTNQPPNASFSANPTSGAAALEVTFDASGASDPDGSVISYSWDLGDGTTDSGGTITHTYNSAGNYTVELTVIDNDGAQASSSKNISVTAPINPPTASFTASPTSGEAPLEVSFDASGSSDSNGNITSYSWNFGDGSSGSGKTTNHTFDSSGNYTVELTVTDNDGATDSAAKTLSVTSPPAVDYWVTAKEITEEVDENPAAVETKYEGKTLGVTGEIDSIDVFLGTTVILKGVDWDGVHCEFPESRQDQVANLSKGQQVTIIGDFDDVTLGSPFLENSYVD